MQIQKRNGRVFNSLSKPEKHSLIIDDIYETGKTLRKLKEIEDNFFYVWYSKQEPKWWSAFKMTEKNEWIVFPWEDQTNAVNDRKSYLNKLE